MTVQVHTQATRYASPWRLGLRVKLLVWDFAWAALCRWTPKPFNAWRLLWLRIFGVRIEGTPFIHQRARVAHPWNLSLEDRACVGDGAVLYCLGKVVLEKGATVAQEAYICTGTHDFGDPLMPLVTAQIIIGADAFVGVRALVLPGVIIGGKAVIGGGSVVTRSVDPGVVAAGNPAKRIRLINGGRK